MMWVAAIGLAAPALATEARSEQPSAIRSRIGPSEALYAMAGVDASRSRRARARLSPQPSVVARLRIGYGVGAGLAVDASSNYFAAHPSARISEYEGSGKLRYSLKLGGEARSAPVVTSNGTRTFLAEGELLGVSPEGRIRHRTALGVSPGAASRSALATSDGGAAVAIGNRVFKLSAFGELEWQAATESPVVELLERDASVLAVTESGAVRSASAHGEWRAEGNLGAPASAVTYDAATDTLFARIGARRLAALDVKRHQRRVLAEEAVLEFDGPLLASTDGTLRVFTRDGLMLRYGRDGSELARVPIDPGARRAPSPEHVLELADGRILIARAGDDTALVAATGEVSNLADSGCSDPVGLYPASANAVLLACRQGTLLRLE